MIVVDSSALGAILFEEPTADACHVALADADVILMSGATLAEVLIVADRRDRSGALREILVDLTLEVVPVTAAFAELVADAYSRWGKGVHPAALNFGDCFAYALAKERRCPLLYVGDDFARTDILSAI